MRAWLLRLLVLGVVGTGFVLLARSAINSIPPLPAPKTDNDIRPEEIGECRRELAALADEIKDASRYLTGGSEVQADVSALEKEIATAQKVLADETAVFNNAKVWMDVFGAGIHTWQERFVLNHHVNRIRLKLGLRLVVVEPEIDRIDDSERARLYSGKTDKIRGPENDKLGREARTLESAIKDAERMLELGRIRMFDVEALDKALSEAKERHPDPMKEMIAEIDRNSWASAQRLGRSFFRDTSVLQFYTNEIRLQANQGMLLLTPNWNQMWPLEERNFLLD